jgi:hypothetical protein
VDELRSGLELATDEELQALSEILFRPGFNPLDYLNPPDLVALQSCSRHDWLDRVEQRFRFLAADGFTVLNGRSQMMSYRQVLLQICRYLKLPYGDDWSTADIEAEVFCIWWMSPGISYRPKSVSGSGGGCTVPWPNLPNSASCPYPCNTIPWGCC